MRLDRLSIPHFIVYSVKTQTTTHELMLERLITTINIKGHLLRSGLRLRQSLHLACCNALVVVPHV